ncbi:hypothetical protein V6N13_064147 [Hibiscus sabdariffa]
MFFSLYYPPSLTPQSNPKVCSQNPKNDLLVCLLGCVVIPPKNGVGHSRDVLVRLEVVEGGEDAGAESRREGVYAKSRCILDPSYELGCRSFSATLEIVKLGQYFYIDGNSRPLCPVRVMNQIVKEFKEIDRVFPKRPTSKVRDSGTWVEPARGSEADNVKWWKAAAANSESTVEFFTAEIGFYSGGHRGKGMPVRSFMSIDFKIGNICLSLDICCYGYGFWLSEISGILSPTSEIWKSYAFNASDSGFPICQKFKDCENLPMITSLEGNKDKQDLLQETQNCKIDTEQIGSYGREEIISMDTQICNSMEKGYLKFWVVGAVVWRYLFCSKDYLMPED